MLGLRLQLFLIVFHVLRSLNLVCMYVFFDSERVIFYLSVNISSLILIVEYRSGGVVSGANLSEQTVFVENPIHAY